MKKLMILAVVLFFNVAILISNASAESCDECEYVGYGKVIDAILVESDGDLSLGNCAVVKGYTIVENGISKQVIESWNYYCEDVEEEDEE